MTVILAARRLLRPLLLVAAALAFPSSLSLAQQPAAQPPAAQKAPAQPAAAKPPKPAPLKKSGPGWAELTPDQQRVLAPLEKDWDQLDFNRKKKWIGVAGRYPSMSATEQQRVQRRMQAWANLTPDQRREARENYRSIAKMPAEKKQDLREAWAEYQALSPEERGRFDVQPVEALPKPAPRRAKPPAPPAGAPSPQTQPAQK